MSKSKQRTNNPNGRIVWKTSNGTGPVEGKCILHTFPFFFVPNLCIAYMPWPCGHKAHVASAIRIPPVKLLKHFPREIVNAIALMQTFAFCSPAIRFLSLAFPFDTVSRARLCIDLRSYATLHRSKNGMASDVSSASRYNLFGASQILKWNCPWTQMEIREPKTRTLNKQNVRCSKGTKH